MTRTTEPLPRAHCSGCGAEADLFFNDDGYSKCCEKRVCHGDGWSAKWSAGDTYESTRELMVVLGCCTADAVLKASALGKVLLERIVR